MIFSFISIDIIDIIDIILVAFIMYKIYMLIRGTVAINIFLGIFLVYLLWQVVKALNMQLLSTILGQFIGVGVIALIIVFQQELRRFLLLLGTRYQFNRRFSVENWFSPYIEDVTMHIKLIVETCKKLSEKRTGALIVIQRRSQLRDYSQTGEMINADITTNILESIFNKNSPLHDGAVIIVGNKINAARCILPISENTEVPSHLGLRHRSALGMSEKTDAMIIVISEETGDLAYAVSGELKTNVSIDNISMLLNEEI